MLNLRYRPSGQSRMSSLLPRMLGESGLLVLEELKWLTKTPRAGPVRDHAYLKPSSIQRKTPPVPP